jgi:hypothetical protein
MQSDQCGIDNHGFAKKGALSDKQLNRLQMSVTTTCQSEAERLGSTQRLKDANERKASASESTELFKRGAHSAAEPSFRQAQDPEPAERATKQEYRLTTSAFAYRLRLGKTLRLIRLRSSYAGQVGSGVGSEARLIPRR